MPHIVALGHTPELDLNTCALTMMRDACVAKSNDDSTCGTSFSAPIANGIGADIIASDTRMASWPEKVRAALPIILTWDGNVSLSDAVNELSDLDLSATSTILSKHSSSCNGNIEMVHFTPTQVQAGTSIFASISQLSDRIPPNATTDYFYYAIAWDWVDQHAP